MTRLLAVALLFVGASASVLRGAEREEDRSNLPEPEQKIRLMLELGVYTQWPDKAMGASTQPIVLGILGPDPFGSFTNYVTGRTLKKRAILVKHFRSAEELTACHLLYVGSKEFMLSSELVEKLAASHILTFGEGKDFVSQGGVVSFVKDGSLVRWTVDRKNAKRNGLQMAPGL